MNNALRRKIKKVILDELRCVGHAYQGISDDQVSERILDEIATILDAGGFPEIDFTQGKRPLSADPLGADRIARTITQEDVDRAHNPLGGASRGVGYCSCPAGPGTDPSCPVHP